MITSLKLSGFWLNVSKLVSGTILAQVVAIILTPFIVRVYSPEAIGELNVINSFAGLIIIIVALRLERAIVLEEGINRTILFNLCNSIVICFVALISIVVFFFNGYFTDTFNLTNSSLVYFIPLIVLLNGLLSNTVSLNNSLQFYGIIAIGTILNSILSNVFKLSFGFLGNRTSELLYAEITALLVTITTLIFFLKIKKGINFFLFPDKLFVRRIFKEHDLFFKYDILTSLINNFSWLVPAFLISYYFNNTYVGYYTLGFTMLRLPMNLIGKSIGVVYYKSVASKQNNEEIASETLNVVRTLLFFGFLPSLIVLLFGEEIFALVFGNNWGEAGIYSEILSFWTLFWLISSPISNLYYVLKLQKQFLIIMIISVVLRILSFVIGGYYDNVYLALYCFSFSSILIYLYQMFYLLDNVGAKPINVLSSLLEELKPLLLPSVLLIVLSFLNLNIYINLGCVAIIAAFSYYKKVRKVILKKNKK
ncbi:oligosaccharide flippase family protein [Flavobacterium sp. PLA-1-15]|uniref:oligosaccharide flippase family protein n=1 Tax=Flavobacterium sp. PLA-1-15 TaxID=3380533 RepID=UPI003B7C987F